MTLILCKRGSFLSTEAGVHRGTTLCSLSGNAVCAGKAEMSWPKMPTASGQLVSPNNPSGSSIKTRLGVGFYLLFRFLGGCAPTGHSRHIVLHQSAVFQRMIASSHWGLSLQLLLCLIRLRAIVASSLREEKTAPSVDPVADQGFAPHVAGARPVAVGSEGRGFTKKRSRRSYRQPCPCGIVAEPHCPCRWNVLILHQPESQNRRSNRKRGASEPSRARTQEAQRVS
jgi:hypothetical protein